METSTEVFNEFLRSLSCPSISVQFFSTLVPSQLSMADSTKLPTNYFQDSFCKLRSYET